MLYLANLTELLKQQDKILSLILLGISDFSLLISIFFQRVTYQYVVNEFNLSV